MVLGCTISLLFSSIQQLKAMSVGESRLLLQDMGASVSAVELMAEQQAPGLAAVHHQHQYPALSLSHVIPRQYPFIHHPQQPTLEQVAAASYQQAIGGYLPAAISTPTAACKRD